MGILQLPTQVPAMVGVLPANKFMVTSDNLATITTAGYLNAVDLQSNPIGAADVLQVLYSYNQQTNSGTYGIFTVSISNGTITLVQWVDAGNVLLPVTNGDFAVFNGTGGQIKDSGYLPSNAALTRVVMESGASVSGNLPKYNDTNGTIIDSGIPASSVSGAITQLGTLYQTSVTLSPTQMAAAYATPAQLIANPAASQMILVHFATVYVASTGNTAYATGTAPIIQYSSGGTNGAHGAGTIATASGLVAGDITAASSQVRNLYGLATSALTGLSGLGIYFSNATGAYTGGTGTNVTFTIVYELLTATV